MEKYLLSIYQPDGDPPPPDVLDEIMRQMEELTNEMRRAGVWVFHAGLQPPGAGTVLRNYDGQVTTTDGPFIEAKEHIGGFTVIRTPDRDTAMEWATRLVEIVTLPVEVRLIEETG
jgi:hypothetical protein